MDLGTLGTVNLAEIGLAGAVIYGIVGGLRTRFPQVVGENAFFVNLVLGAVFGYLQLFGLSGIEAGLAASLGISTINTFANKIKGK